jgi:hypothetical protein
MLLVNVAKLLNKLLTSCSFIFKRILITGESKTYTIEQTILEGLMVPRYNLINPRKFIEFFKKQDFLIDIEDDITHSMTCIIAKKCLS